MNIIAVGSVAYDSIETPEARYVEILGGAASHFALSAANFAPVSIIGVVGEDFNKEYLELFEAKGIDISGIETAVGKTFRWIGKYEDNPNHAITLDTQLNVFEHFSPKLKEAHQNGDIIFLANIMPSLQLQALRQMRKPLLRGADTMNLWINTEKETLQTVIQNIDLLFLNDGELKLLCQDQNTVRAMKKLMKRGLRGILVKRGEYGVIGYFEDQFFGIPAYPTEEVKDPTGAGDSFAGGFLGHIARSNGLTQRSFREAVIYGAVMSSFWIREFGQKKHQGITLDLIETRYQTIKKMIFIES